MTKQEKGILFKTILLLFHKKLCYFLLNHVIVFIMNYLRRVLSRLNIYSLLKIISKDENYINTSKKREKPKPKYDSDDEDYQIFKALAKNYDRKSFEELLVMYGLTDVIDLD